ncbi:MAG: glutamate--tRNA ligase [Parvularculales bacterium]
MAAQQVITRFAPSPSGYLHIGGARTALFNWLYARHYRGKFLLRIEDTDRDRSTDEAVSAILDGLRWLELDWDEEPVFQYSRRERHTQIANGLLESGEAYHCYCTPETLTEMREKAKREGKPIRYDGRCRNLEKTPSTSTDIKPVLRIRMPQAGKTTLQDLVQGTVTVPAAALDDFILLRSDGSPTYMLSVVVDDHDMAVSHVIRGDDHLTNALRQLRLYKALNWITPTFAHIPLIHGVDGAKLSKRHGALGLESYCKQGYLPETLRNYLNRLGWSHGNDEIFSTDQAIEWFTLDKVGRSPARFDKNKLKNLNGHYIRIGDDTLLMRVLTPLLQERYEVFSSDREEQVRSLLPALKERTSTVVELADGVAFLFAERPLVLDAKADTLINEGTKPHLQDIAERLSTLQDWTPEALNKTIRDYAETHDIGLGKIAQPLRAALTGSSISPGIFDVLRALGKSETLARLQDQISG